MKVILLIVMVGLLAGYAQCKPCPPNDAFTMIHPYGLAEIPKGFFDDPDNWITEDALKKKLEEHLERREQKGI